jgi:hypothetical protein
MASGWQCGCEAEAIGIDYVIVNGEVLLERGEHTGALPGQVLSRSPVPGEPCVSVRS